MFDFLIPATTTLHVWFYDNVSAIRSAAYVRGGQGWMRRAERLFDDLRNGGSLTSRIERELRDLYGLFTLSKVADPSSEEAEYFSAIDPDDPVVAEICLLTEHFAEAACGAGLRLGSAPEAEWPRDGGAA